MITHSKDIYCPYTGNFIQVADTNAWSWDHIVPLFMGGDNRFQVRACRKANNDVGSRIEGPMKNDFFLSFALRASGIIGRSGDVTLLEWKNCLVDGRKTHIKLGPANNWTFWDKVDRKYLDVSGRDQVPVESSIKFNIYDPLRLSAKILLGTMVFMFGDDARKFCNLNDFRIVMNMKSIDDLSAISTKDFRILQRHDPETSQMDTQGFVWKLIAEAFDRTCLVITPYEGAFGFHVAIAGQHQASFQFEGDTSKVPRGGLFDIAHIILLGPGKMRRCSLRSVQSQITERVEKLRAQAKKDAAREAPRS